MIWLSTVFLSYLTILFYLSISLKHTMIKLYLKSFLLWFIVASFLFTCWLLWVFSQNPPSLGHKINLPLSKPASIFHNFVGSVICIFLVSILYCQIACILYGQPVFPRSIQFQRGNTLIFISFLILLLWSVKPTFIWSIFECQVYAN